METEAVKDGGGVGSGSGAASIRSDKLSPLLQTRITGWLLKKPGKAHFLGMKPWQRRFVVLDCLSSTLVYYKNQECVHANKVSGTIFLIKMERVEKGADKTDFNVHTSSIERGIYSFRCANEDECNKWYDCLKVYGKAFRGTDSSQQQCVKMKVLISVSVKLPRGVAHVQPVAFLEAQSVVTEPGTNQVSTQWGEVGRTEILEGESGSSKMNNEVSGRRKFFVLLGATVDTADVKLEGMELMYTSSSPLEYRVVVCDSKRLNKERMERPYVDGFRAAQSESATILKLPFTLKQLLGQPDGVVVGYFADSEDASRRKHDDAKAAKDGGGGVVGGGREKLSDPGILELRFEGAQECVEFSGGRVTEQSYKIPRKSGGWIILHERLAESPFTFTVPYQLFHRMWANECMWLKKLKFAVTTKEKRKETMKPPDDFHRMANLLADAFGMDEGKSIAPNPFNKLDDEIAILKSEIRLSSEYKNQLLSQKKLFQNYNASYLGLRFKPSVKKNDHVLAWIATNLHKQTFQVSIFDHDQSHKGEVVGDATKVIMATPNQKHEQDTITVGAFAAHPLKFKHGGMSGCCAEIVDLRGQVAQCRQVGTQLKQKLSLKLRTKEHLLDQRKAMVWSQALSALTSAFVAHLIKQLRDIMAGNISGSEILLRQQEIGFLVQVESLLSTFAHERGMLEDHQYAVGRMRNTRFRCRRVNATSASQESLIRAEIVGVVLASRSNNSADDEMMLPPSSPVYDRDASVDPSRFNKNFVAEAETVSLRPRSVWLPSTSIASASSEGIPMSPRDWTTRHEGDSIVQTASVSPSHQNTSSSHQSQTHSLPTSLSSPSSARNSTVAPPPPSSQLSSSAPVSPSKGTAPPPPPRYTTPPPSCSFTEKTDSPRKEDGNGDASAQLKPYLSVADAWKANTEEKVAKLRISSSAESSSPGRTGPLVVGSLGSGPYTRSGSGGANASHLLPLFSTSRSQIIHLPNDINTRVGSSPNTILFSELMDSYFAKDASKGLSDDFDDSPDEKDETDKFEKASVSAAAMASKDHNNNNVETPSNNNRRTKSRWLSFAGVQVRSLSGHRILDKATHIEKNNSLPVPLTSSLVPQLSPAAIHTTGNLPDTPPTPTAPSFPSSQSSHSFSTTHAPPPPPSRMPSSISTLPLKSKTNAPEASSAVSTPLQEFRPGQSDRGHLDEGCLVELLLPSFLFDVLPSELRYRDDTSEVPLTPNSQSSVSEPREVSLEFEAYPILITQGVNEQQSVADTINKGLREQQTIINRIAVQNLTNYAADFTRYQRAPDKKLNEMIRSMELQARSENNSKNLDLLHDVARSVRHMSGSRIVCCKSAKDRTAMSVTLDQYRLVKKVLDEDLLTKSDVDEVDLIRWLQVSRVEGVRIQNTSKNTGQRGFAFNAFQRSCLPELFRPPESACGKSQPT